MSLRIAGSTIDLEDWAPRLDDGGADFDLISPGIEESRFGRNGQELVTRTVDASCIGPGSSLF